MRGLFFAAFVLASAGCSGCLFRPPQCCKNTVLARDVPYEGASADGGTTVQLTVRADGKGELRFVRNGVEVVETFTQN